MTKHLLLVDLENVHKIDLFLLDETNQMDLSTGIYDDGEWMCGGCVSGYAT